MLSRPILKIWAVCMTSCLFCKLYQVITTPPHTPWFIVRAVSGLTPPKLWHAQHKHGPSGNAGRFSVLSMSIIRFLVTTFFGLVFAEQTANAQNVQNNAPTGWTLSLQKDDQPLTSHVVGRNDLTVNATVALVGGTSTTATEVPITIAGSGIAGVIPFRASDFTITIPAGQASASANFTITLHEKHTIDAYGDETITVTATPPISGLTPSPASFTLTDNIDVVVSHRGVRSPVMEGDAGTTDVTMEIKIDIAQRGGEGSTGGVIKQPMMLDYAISGDGVTATDITSRTGTVTIPSDIKQPIFTLPIILGDTLDEDDESFTITLSSPRLTTTGADFSGGVTAEVTITDDDTTQIEFADTGIEVDEGAGSATFTIALAPLNAFPVTVNYATADGTADAGSDYTAITSGSITIPAMSASATFSVPVIDDRGIEGDETFTVRLTSTSRGALGTATTAMATIINDDPTPYVESATSNIHGNKVVITFSEPIANHAAPADFAIAGVASNPAVTSLAVDGATLTLELSGVILNSESITLSYNKGSGSITNADERTLISFTGQAVTNAVIIMPVITTPAQTVNMATVMLSGTAEAGSTVELFRATGSGTVSLGTTTATNGAWTISVMLSEGANTITAIATGEDVGVSDAVIINRSPLPTGWTLSLQKDSQPLTNHVATSSSFKVQVTVTLEGGVFADDTQVPIAIAGSGVDGVIPYESLSNSIAPTIPAGQTSASASFIVRTTLIPAAVPAAADGAYGDETITLTATLPTTSGLAPASASFTLTDDIDVALVVKTETRLVRERNKGTSTVNFTLRVNTKQGQSVIRNAGAKQPLSVDYTFSFSGAAGAATAADVVTPLTGTLMIPANKGEHTFQLPAIRGDTLDEDDEQFTITFSNPRLVTTGATIRGRNTLTVIIKDDDTTQVQFADTSVEVGEEADSATFTITLAPLNAFPLTVDYMTSDGTANAGSDYTTTTGSITIPAMTASATFSAPVLEDVLVEGTENFTVTLTDTDRGELGVATVATATIIDNDPIPYVLSATSNIHGNQVVITFSEPITNHAAPTDFAIAGVASSLEVTSLAVDGATLTLSLSGNIIRGNGNIVLSYSKGAGAQGGITNSLGRALASFGGQPVTNAVIIVPVITTPAQTINTATVTLSGTAEAGSTVELFSTTGSGTVSLGSTIATNGAWTISVMLIEGVNTITAIATGEDIGVADAVIINRSPLPTGLILSLQENGQELANHIIIEEGAFSASATVTLQGGVLATNTEITISIAGSGIDGAIPFKSGDYVHNSDAIPDFTITIPAGQPSASADFRLGTFLTLANDAAYGDEIITLTATPPTTLGLTPGSASFKLTDNNEIALVIQAGTLSSGQDHVVSIDEGSRTIDIEMRIEAFDRRTPSSTHTTGTRQPLSIDYTISFSGTATAADVVASLTGTLVIPKLKSIHTFTLDLVLDDTIYEEDEQFAIIFSNPRLATTGATISGSDTVVVTIVDNEGPPPDPSVCARTTQVRDAIVATIADATDCSEISVAHLETITLLNLGNKMITGLQAGDFAGLSALLSLDLRENQFTMLPTGIFADLPATAVIHLDPGAIVTPSADAFVTTWMTTRASETIAIPTEGGGYNYNVDCDGDSVNEHNNQDGQDGDVTCAYATAGTHTVVITGDFPRIYFNDEGDKEKIIAINQWGTGRWTSMARAFDGASNLTGQASDEPDLSLVTSMNRMFRNASSFNQDIRRWKVGSVTNMAKMFNGAAAFNQDISRWDVSSVTNMGNMFKGATAFSQNLGRWFITPGALSVAENVSAGSEVGTLSAQNAFLKRQTITYSLTSDAMAPFTLNGNALSITRMPPAEKTGKIYTVTVTARPPSGFGTANTVHSRDITIKVVHASSAFITTWRTSDVDETITIPTFTNIVGETNETYSYTVDWGDGGIDTTTYTGNATHTYARAGMHTVVISGTFPRIYFNNGRVIGDDKAKIIAINQWGRGTWTSMAGAFYGAINLVGQATDEPDLSRVTNMSRMFEDARAFNQNIGGWDVSNVTNMAFMFNSASAFHQNLGNWTVSSVKDMSYMFAYATNFNGNIDWTVSSVTNMRSMFEGARVFNQDIGRWDVSGVTNMRSMFAGARVFNQDISGWDVSSVANMRSMFADARVFNQDISGWDVSSVANMAFMFEGARVFNQDIGRWDVSSATNMTSMLTNAAAFSQNLGRWYITPDVLNVTENADSGTQVGTLSAQNMFLNNQSPGYSITSGGDPFYLRGSTIITNSQTPLAGKIYTVTVTVNISRELALVGFYGTHSRDIAIKVVRNPNAFITTWRTTSDGESITIPTFTDIEGETDEAYDYTVAWGDGTIETNQTGNATHSYADAGTYTVVITGTFPRIYFNNTGDKYKIIAINQWGTGTWTSMENAFYGASNLQITAIDNPDLSAVTSMSGMFKQAFSGSGITNISTWDVSEVEKMDRMFMNATLFNQDLSDWDVSSVTDMGNMFASAISFNQDISDWDVSSVTDMEDMFSNANRFKQNLGRWYITPEALDVDEYASVGATSATLSAQNTFLNAQTISYTLTGGDAASFTLSGEGGSTIIKSRASPPLSSTQSYQVTVSASGGFGTANSRDITINVVRDPSTFVTTWRTGGANETITIPTFTNIAGETDEIYDYTVDWGDGNTSTNQTGDAMHSYADAGDYTVVITGTFPRIYFNNEGDKEKIIAINQWGTGRWTSMENAFDGASNLAGQATDEPDLSRVTSMSRMFQDARAFNQNIGNWTVNLVADMSNMFSGASVFNQNIGGWDVSGVTNMSSMFSGASVFNQNIGGWDVSGVTNMSSMFSQATAFNQNIGGWDVSGVTNMSSMFSGASVFNQNIGGWDVSGVTNMSSMFSQATAFNQNIGGWDVSGVTNMGSMFLDATAFSQNLGRWFITPGALSVAEDASTGSEVGTLSAQNAFLREQAIAYSLTGGATASFALSGNALSITRVPPAAKTGKIYTVTVTARPPSGFGAATHRRNIAIKVINNSRVFITTWWTSGANETITIPTTGDGYSYTVDWGDSSNDTTTYTGNAMHIYSVAGTHTVVISGTFPRIYFNNAGDKDKIIAVNQWGMGRQWASMENAFYGAGNLQITATDQPDLSAVKNMAGMFLSATAFNSDISGWGVGNVTNMRDMFNGASSFNQNLGDWDVSRVKDMSYMFADATDFNGNIDWTVSSVVNMGRMFLGATAFNQDIGNWTVSSVTDMDSMFDRASAFNQDIGGWDISNVASMSQMFSGASTFSQNLGRWYITPAELSVADGATDGTQFATLLAQNTFLNGQRISYTLTGGDTASFALSGERGSRISRSSSPLPAGPPPYIVTVTASGGFGTANSRDIAINVVLNLSAFVTTWRTAGDSESITIPTFTNIAGETDEIYDYTVDWGDGQVTDHTGDATHTYANAGTHTVVITGTFPRIYFNNAGDKYKIIAINQWGTGRWTSMAKAFYGATDLAGQASDNPDLSQVTNMTRMFFSASSFNQDLSAWDVSNVTTMKEMFRGASVFNQPLGDWQVGSVEDMSFMFSGASIFNQNISDWDVSGVVNMELMFTDATAFSQNLGRWYITSDLLSVIDTDLVDTPFAIISAQNTFLNAQNISYTLAGTDAGFFALDGNSIKKNSPPPPARAALYQVTVSASGGFGTANSRDITINVVRDLDAFVTTWQTNSPDESITIPTFTNIRDETDEIYDYTVDWGDGNASTNQTGNATHSYADAGTYTVVITGTFPRIYFNNTGDKYKIIAINQWGTGTWTSMENAFYGASNLQITAIDNPDLSAVTSMSGMFKQAFSGSGITNISTWDVSEVEKMDRMFMNATLFNQDLSDWDVSSVTDMGNMFASAISFNQDISDWDVSSVTDMEDMFSNANRFKQNLGRWYITPEALDVDEYASVGATSATLSAQNTFLNAQTISYTLTGGDAASFTLSGEGGSTIIKSRASPPLSSTQSYQVTVSASGGFGTANSRDITINVVRDPSAFVTTWRTGGANETITIPTFTNIAGETDEIYDYTVDWGDGNTSTNQTGNATHSYANAGTHKVVITGTFPRIYFNNEGDKAKIMAINQWGTGHQWTSMAGAFYGASNLAGQATDAPDLSRVTSMNRMFQNARAFNQNIGGWDVSRVTDMANMFFHAAAFNQNIGGWTVSSATNMSFMFFQAAAFNQNIGGWTVSSVGNMEFMFAGARKFNQDISGWDVSSVGNMEFMFADASKFNQDISGWDVRGVTDMELMFTGANAFSQNLGRWYITPDAYSVTEHFSVGTQFGTIKAQNNFLNGQSPSYTLTGTDAKFFTLDGSSISKSDLSPLARAAPYQVTVTASGGFGTANSRNIEIKVVLNSNVFITTWRTTASDKTITIPTFTNIAGAIDENYNYTVDWGDGTISFGQTGNVTHTYATAGTHTIAILDTFPRIYFEQTATSTDQKLRSVAQWGTTAWTSMEDAFNRVRNLQITATDKPNLSAAVSMARMFSDASGLNGDISGWDVSGVKNMGYLFNNISNFNQDLSGWDVSSVTSMFGMFRNTSVFNQNISGWDVSGVTNMIGMFEGAPAFNQNISGWDVSSVTSMSGMFRNALAFNQDLSGWDVSSVTALNDMFTKTALSSTNYDKLLIGWAAQNLQRGKTFDVGATRYCSDAALDARSRMTSRDGWTINDGGRCHFIRIASDGGSDTATISIPENQRSVTTVRGFSSRGHGITYSLSGTDSGSFTIDATSGELQFANVNGADFETPGSVAATNEYVVVVTATDDSAQSLTKTQIIAVTVLNAELMVTISSDRLPFLNSSGHYVIEIAENTQRVATIMATSERDDTFIYTLPTSSASHNALFDISQSGELTFKTQYIPDYEKPRDKNGDFKAPDQFTSNDYIVEVTVTSGDGSSVMRTILVDVGNVNPEPPADILLSSNLTSTHSTADTVIGTLSKTGGITDVTTTFALVSGDGDNSNSLFRIDGTELKIRNTPKKAAFSIRIGVNNGASTFSKAFIIIQDGNRPPIIGQQGTCSYIASAARSRYLCSIMRPENTQFITTMSATDPDGDSIIRWDIVNHDSELMEINQNGAISFKTEFIPDFENPTDFNGNILRAEDAGPFIGYVNNDYHVLVRSYDDRGLIGIMDMEITITDVNPEPPAAIALSSTTVAHDAPDATLIGTLSKTGGITNNPTTFTLVDSELPTDNALFEIDGTELKIKAMPASNVIRYYIVIGVNNGAGILSAGFTIEISGITTPEITTNGGADEYPITLDENTQSVATITAVDADGDTFTYSLSGNDSEAFAINQTGELIFKPQHIPNFEEPSDLNMDNVYSTNVRVTDIRGLFDRQIVRVTIRDVNEAPTISGTPATTIAEDAAYTFTPIGNDEDAGTTLEYAITNTPTWAEFNEETGALSGTPTNTHVGITADIVISVSDGVARASLDAFDLEVTNTNDAPTGLPTITGTPTQGGTLTVDTTAISDADGVDTNTFTYQWLGAGVAIDGASSSTFVLTQVQVGQTMTVRVGYTDQHNTTETLTATPTSTVTNINDAPTGLPTISGTPTQGGTLRVDTAAIRDADGTNTFTYQWQGGGNDISGATDTSLVLMQAEVGQTITVQVSYIDGGGTTETLTAAPTSMVTNINDAPTGLPTISGTPTQGGTLRVDTAAIRDADGTNTFTYQWQGGGNDISGATDTSLVLMQAEVGQTITVQVSYIDGGGTTETLTATPTTTVANINDAPTGLPTISGTPTQGGTLRVDTAAIRDADGTNTFTYQWQGGGNDISGATDTLLVLTQAQVGQTITVQVSYIDGGGTTETLTATPTTTVANINDAPTGLPTISGTPTQGGTLRVDTAAIRDADGTNTFTYQWQGGGNDISGATDTSLVLMQAEVGQTITVQVSYIDGGGTTETLTATPTTTVANINDAPTGLPTISGTPTQGGTLRVDTAAIRDADGTNTFTYQWQGGGNDISGATDTLLVLTQAQVGQTITVQVSYIDGGGTTETLTATPTTTVANINDAPTGLPTISGTPTQGGTLRVDTAAIRDADGTNTFTYQWQGGGNDISGAAVRPIRAWC